MIGELVSRRARRDGPRPALLCDGVRVDFAELEARARAAAAALADLGVGKGDRVAALMRNGIDLVCLYHGAAKAGVVLCPLNWRLAPPEIGRILNHAEPKLLVLDPEFAATAAAPPGPAAACATVAAPDFVAPRRRRGGHGGGLRRGRRSPAAGLHLGHRGASQGRGSEPPAHVVDRADHGRDPRLRAARHRPHRGPPCSMSADCPLPPSRSISAPAPRSCRPGTRARCCA